MTEDLYAILKVEAKATDAEIKSAYRTLAKELHPDKRRHAEESEAEAEVNDQLFKTITEAYEILSDPAKRRLYDETGIANTQARAQRIEAEASEQLVFEFLSILDQSKEDFRHHNILLQIQQKLIDRAQNLIELKAETLRKRERTIDVQKRVVHHGGSGNAIGDAISRRIELFKRDLADYDERMAIIYRMGELLPQYSYKVDPAWATEPTARKDGRYPAGFFGGTLPPREDRDIVPAKAPPKKSPFLPS